MSQNDYPSYLVVSQSKLSKSQRLALGVGKIVLEVGLMKGKAGQLPILINR